MVPYIEKEEKIRMFKVVSEFSAENPTNFVLSDGTRYQCALYRATVFVKTDDGIDHVRNSFCKLMRVCRLEPGRTRLPEDHVVELQVRHVLRNEYEAEAWF